jgi:hypothetical protein
MAATLRFEVARTVHAANESISISGNSARVTVEGRFTARNWLAETIVWPVAKPMLRRLTRSVINELEAYLVLGLGV